MKLILTGSSGFIGGEVLTQTLAHPSITSIVALSRRPLPNSITSGPHADKLLTVIVKDFSSYSDDVLEKCKGAQGCIWSLGVARSQSSTGESSQEVNIDYTLAATTKFQESLVPNRAAGDEPFRFVYLSGIITERNQKQSLWFLDEPRKLRGDLENRLLSLSTSTSAFQSLIVRPGFVLAKTNPIPSAIVNVLPAVVRVDELAATMVEIAVRGTGSEECTVENDRLKKFGRQLLERSG